MIFFDDEDDASVIMELLWLAAVSSSDVVHAYSLQERETITSSVYFICNVTNELMKKNGIIVN